MLLIRLLLDAKMSSHYKYENHTQIASQPPYRRHNTIVNQLKNASQYKAENQTANALSHIQTENESIGTSQQNLVIQSANASQWLAYIGDGWKGRRQRTQKMPDVRT